MRLEFPTSISVPADLLQRSHWVTIVTIIGFLQDFHELPYHKSIAGGVK